MSGRDVYLGVDGGGTKTEFVCIDREGAVIARAFTGTTYHLQVGLEEAVRRLGQGLASVCADLGIVPADIAHAFFGLPAYGEDGTIDPQLHAACSQLLGHTRYSCGNDMVCGWAGSLGCEDGINIVAGTGSIGYGERGMLAARVGGWGEVFSDEGSAYWIAAQGLTQFSRMSDGRAEKTLLHSRIVEILSLRQDLELCERIMGPDGMGRSEIAGLARVVSKAATDGDPVAATILDNAARELAELACALRNTLGFGPDVAVPLSWSGSVLNQEPLVRYSFLALLRDKGFRFVEPLFEPGVGAALYARKQRRRSPG